MNSNMNMYLYILVVTAPDIHGNKESVRYDNIAFFFSEKAFGIVVKISTT
jgi:hypothetical protein